MAGCKDCVVVEAIHVDSKLGVVLNCFLLSVASEEMTFLFNVSIALSLAPTVRQTLVF